MHPRFILLGGLNGSGKSSLVNRIEPTGLDDIINPDTIRQEDGSLVPRAGFNPPAFRRAASSHSTSEAIKGCAAAEYFVSGCFGPSGVPGAKPAFMKAAFRRL